MDLSKTIIPKSDQLNADDLISGARTIKIRDVKAGTDEQQPVSIYFDGDDNKPYKPCKSMRRLLVQVWGAESDAYIGRSMTIYLDTDVSFGGVKVGGIRISHVSNIDAPIDVLITVAKSKRRPFKLHPLLVSVDNKPKSTAKKAIKDFDAMKTAVQSGSVTIETIITQYELTAEQLQTLTTNKDGNI